MTEHMQEIRVRGKAARIRGATWTHDQVEKLLEIWARPDIYRALLYEKKKQDIFKNMAVILADLGISRSWTECRAKIKNLKADFRKAMEGKITFRYFDEMRKIMTLKGSSSSRVSAEATATVEQQSQSHRRQNSEEGSDNEDYVDSGSGPMSAASSSHHSEYITASPYHLPPQTPPSPSFVQSSQPSRGSYDEQYYQSGRDEDSRSSMVITHVVSKVIEPVTPVVIPSTSGTTVQSSTGHDYHQHHHHPSHSVGSQREIDEIQKHSEQPPIRLEFVLDDENLILQEPADTDQTQAQSFENIDDRVSHDDISYENQQSTAASAEILKERLTREAPKPRTPPQQRHRSPAQVQSPNAERGRRVPLPSSCPKTPRVIPPPPLKKRKLVFPPPTAATASGSGTEGKRRMLEALNKKTLETISTLLTESSRSLLKELQDAEERFLLWEEDKRSEERKSEEAMFTKLIGAMQTSFQQSSKANVDVDGTQSQSQKSKTDKDLIDHFGKDLKTVSKRLNDIVTEEVKATEESVRDWEVKMQRQESRHTEKLFAMIVNAIKIPPAND